MTLSAHDRTLACLAEVNPRVYAALAAAGPNNAGDPPLGALGWLPPDDLADLARAAMMAHGTTRPGWDWTDPHTLARYLADAGSWRRHDCPARDRAVTAYSTAPRIDLACRDLTALGRPTFLRPDGSTADLDVAE